MLEMYDVLKAMANCFYWSEGSMSDIIDWISYWAKALQLELDDPQAQLVEWFRLRQPLFEIFMITTGNLTMVP